MTIRYRKSKRLQMFALLIFRALGAIDENQFATGKFCECAVNPGRCNPYCFCDPYCTDFEKSTFTFALPEQASPVKVSCDPMNYISKKNLATVQEIQINNVKCYILTDDPATLPKMRSYTPAEFGLTDWSQLASVPPNASVIQLQTYVNNDPILLTPNNVTGWFAGLIPVAFGSHECNMFVPVAYQMYVPESACSMPQTFTSWEDALPLFFDDTGSRSAKYFALNPNYTLQGTPNAITVTPATAALTNGTVNLTFGVQQGNGQVTAMSMTREMGADNYSDLNVLVSSVGDLAGTVQPTYATVRSGYYVGSPIRTREGTNDASVMTFLSANGTDVLFGHHSVYVLSPSPGNETLTMSTLGGIWATLGNIVQLSNDTTLQNAPIIPQIVYTDGTTDTVNPSRARWTFMYRKFGYSHMWVYGIVAVRCEVYLSGVDIAQIETVFIELTENCSARYIPPGEPEYVPSLSMVFDVFFERQSDSLQTVGVLACIAILATVWAYLVFYFDSW